MARSITWLVEQLQYDKPDPLINQTLDIWILSLASGNYLNIWFQWKQSDHLNNIFLFHIVLSPYSLQRIVVSCRLQYSWSAQFSIRVRVYTENLDLINNPRQIRTVVKMAASDLLDLKKQFVFYASYHNHPVNVLIHLACIWNLSIEKHHGKHTTIEWVKKIK